MQFSPLRLKPEVDPVMRKEQNQSNENETFGNDFRSGHDQRAEQEN